MYRDGIRILVVDDNEHRITTIRQWTQLPSVEVRITWARTAGLAIGILRRDRGRAFDGIVLDHDLNEQCITDVDHLVNGKDVADAIVQNVDGDVPILIDSGNRTEGPKLAARLLGCGFDVEYVPFEELRHSDLRAWLKGVVEASADVTIYRRWQSQKKREDRRLVPREPN